MTRAPARRRGSESPGCVTPRRSPGLAGRGPPSESQAATLIAISRHLARRQAATRDYRRGRQASAHASDDDSDPSGTRTRTRPAGLNRLLAAHGGKLCQGPGGEVVVGG